MSAEPERYVLDAENPWPGLMPFTEEAQGFFHGRDEETAELVRLIRRATLTVLFGQSGLGKSSLLNAGLFPQLRKDDTLPIYVRLDIAPGAPALDTQVRTAIAGELTRHQMDARAPREDETLWEYFHRKDLDFWSSRNRLLTPLLAFDQFEELFTLGRASEELRARCDTFLTGLASLIENRAPESVLRRLDQDPDLSQHIAFARQDYKVLLAFREDFLPDLENLRAEIPSIMHNRMRLTRMNGEQARQAVVQSGGRLVDADVTDRIIRFVAGPRADGMAGAGDFARLEVEPALLSLVCRELNNKRIAAGRDRITADLIESGAQQAIIADFYERSLADLDPRVRIFVEDQLLTESGYRDSYALEDALGLPGVTRRAIDALVARRLLRLEERFGVLRIELTHDVLTKVVRDSRDRRQTREREAQAREAELRRRRRARRLVAIGATAFVAVLALAIVFAVLMERAVRERDRVIEAQSNVLVSRAVSALEQNVPREPQAYLARAIRMKPDNQGAIGRAVTLLTQRSYPAYLAGAALSGFSPGHAIFWFDDRRIAWGAGGRFSLLAAANPEDVVEARVVSDHGYPDFVRIVWRDPRVFPPPTADSRKGRAGDSVPGLYVLKSHHGDSNVFVAASVGRDKDEAQRAAERKGVGSVLPGPLENVVVLDAATLQRIGPLLPVAGAIVAATPSPDRRTIAIAVEETSKSAVYLWDLSPGALDGSQPKPRLALPDRAVKALHFTPDGRRLLIGYKQSGSRLVDVAGERSRSLTLQLPEDAEVAFAPEARLLLAWSGSAARFWDLDSGKPAGEPLRHAAPINAAAFSPDGRLLVTASQDQTARIWRVDTRSLATPPLAHDGSVVLARFSPDGRLVITASLDGTARIWDPRNGAQVMEPFLHDAPVVAAAFSPDGRRAVTVSNDGALKIWETSAPRASMLTVARTSPVTALAPSADGQLLAAGTAEGGVEIFRLPPAFGRDDAAASRIAQAVERHRTTVTAVAFSPDARRVYSASRDGVARAWDVATGKPIGRPMRHFGPVRQLSVSGDGRLLATSSEDRTARLWEADTGSPATLPLRHRDNVLSATFDASGRRALTASADGNARVWDVSTGFPLVTLPHGERVSGAAFSPDGHRILTTAGNTISVWRLDEVERILASRAVSPAVDGLTARGTIALKRPAWSARYSRDGQRIVSASLDGTVQVWDARALAPLTPPMKHGSPVLAAEFSSDGRWIVTRSDDRIVRIWDAASGQSVADSMRNDYDVSAAVLMPDNDRIVVGTADGHIRLWTVGLGFDRNMPAWLLPLIEATAGTRIDESGVAVSMEDAAQRLREIAGVAAAAGDEWWGRWARWFFASPQASRTASR